MKVTRKGGAHQTHRWCARFMFGNVAYASCERKACHIPCPNPINAHDLMQQNRDWGFSFFRRPHAWLETSVEVQIAANQAVASLSLFSLSTRFA